MGAMMLVGLSGVVAQGSGRPAAAPGAGAGNSSANLPGAALAPSATVTVPTTTSTAGNSTTITSSPSIPTGLTCLERCNGGECLADGGCQCPFRDPRTGKDWGVPPSPDCALYGMEAFGVAFPIFRWSWILVFGGLFLLMMVVNIRTIVRQGRSYSLNPKELSKWAITLSFLAHLLYYSIDPYGLMDIMDAISRRTLYVFSHFILLFAYTLMLTRWMEICQLLPDGAGSTATGSSPTDHPGTKPGSGRQAESGTATTSSTPMSGTPFIRKYGIYLISLFLLVGWIAATYVSATNDSSYSLYFLILFVCVGLVVIVTVPMYIYYGQRLVKLLEASHIGKIDKGGKLRMMLRQIRLLTYGPGMFMILTFAAVGATSLWMRGDPDLYLIGESMVLFFETLSFGIFAYALFNKQFEHKLAANQQSLMSSYS